MTLANQNRQIVKPVVIGESLNGVPILALRVTRDARESSNPDGSKPAVLYNAAQHAREWITPEMTRRLAHLFVDNYGETGPALGTDGRQVVDNEGVPIQAEDLTESSTTASCGSSRSSTRTATTSPSKARTPGCGARTCATSTTTARSARATAWTPTATGPPNGTTTGRARAPIPLGDLPRHRSCLRARGGAPADAVRRARPALPDRLPLHRSADPVPGGLAGPDAGHGRSHPQRACRRRPEPGDRGLRPRPLGGALHHQRRHHRRHAQGLRHDVLHGGADRGQRSRGRRDRRNRPGLHAGRVRLPGRGGGDPARVRDQPPVRARSCAVGGRSGRPRVAPGQRAGALDPLSVLRLDGGPAERRGQRQARAGTRRGQVARRQRLGADRIHERVRGRRALRRSR